MPGGVLAITLWLALASSPGDVVAMAETRDGVGQGLRDLTAAALPDVSGMVEAALPPPPQRVFLVTRSYGTVVVDHKAHLARRASCKTCHGPGQITKIERFPPRVAHDRCVGCHNEQKRGPTGCRECHLQTPPEPRPGDTIAGGPLVRPEAPKAEAVATAKPGEGTQKAGAKKEQPRPPAEWVARLAAEPSRSSSTFSRTAEVGYTFLSTGGLGPAAGAGGRLVFAMDNVRLTESIDVAMGGGNTRILGLVGGGAAFDVVRHVRVAAVAVGGFDALNARAGVNFSPSVGANLRVEVTDLLFRNSMSISLVGLTALGSRSDGDTKIDPLTLGLTASIGFGLGSTR